MPRDLKKKRQKEACYHKFTLDRLHKIPSWTYSFRGESAGEDHRIKAGVCSSSFCEASANRCCAFSEVLIACQTRPLIFFLFFNKKGGHTISFHSIMQLLCVRVMDPRLPGRLRLDRSVSVHINVMARSKKLL